MVQTTIRYERRLMRYDLVTRFLSIASVSTLPVKCKHRLYNGVMMYVEMRSLGECIFLESIFALTLDGISG